MDIDVPLFQQELRQIEQSLANANNLGIYSGDSRPFLDTLNPNDPTNISQKCELNTSSSSPPHLQDDSHFLDCFSDSNAMDIDVFSLEQSQDLVVVDQYQLASDQPWSIPSFRLQPAPRKQSFPFIFNQSPFQPFTPPQIASDAPQSKSITDPEFFAECEKNLQFLISKTSSKPSRQKRRRIQESVPITIRDDIVEAPKSYILEQIAKMADDSINNINLNHLPVNPEKQPSKGHKRKLSLQIDAESPKSISSEATSISGSSDRKTDLCLGCETAIEIGANKKKGLCTICRHEVQSVRQYAERCVSPTRTVHLSSVHLAPVSPSITNSISFPRGYSPLTQWPLYSPVERLPTPSVIPQLDLMARMSNELQAYKLQFQNEEENTGLNPTSDPCMADCQITPLTPFFFKNVTPKTPFSAFKTFFDQKSPFTLGFQEISRA